MKLLLVEDDAELANYLNQELKRAGYAVELSNNGIDAEFLGNEESFDAVILDLGLPDKPGLEILRCWREQGNTVPVLILTARDAWHERVDGLKMGADDYLGKPFHREELLARLQAVLRRHQGRAVNEIQQHGWTLDCDQQTLFNGQKQIHQLTRIEFRLLHYLMSNPGKVLSKQQLSEHVYEEDHLRDSNVIEVYINRLRQLLGPDLILTRRGQGYFWKAAE